MYHRIFTCALLILLSGITLQAQDVDILVEEDSGDIISTQFGWYPGLTVQVDQEWEKVQKNNGALDSFGTRWTYRLNVLEQEGGLLVHIDSVKVVGKKLPIKERAKRIGELLAKAVLFNADYVLTTDGKFVGVNSPEETRENLRSYLLEETERQIPTGIMKSLLDTMMTTNLINSILLTEWNAIVGGWGPYDLEIGTTYEFTMSVPHPLSPEVLIPMEGEIVASKRCPCNSADRSNSCVEMRLLTTTDSAALKQMIVDLVARMKGATKSDIDMKAFEEMFSSMTMTTDLNIIVEPEKLLPHYLTMNKLNRMKGKKGEETEQQEIRTYRFQYQSEGE